MRYLICLLLLSVACAPQKQVTNVVIPTDPLRENLQWQSSEPWLATNLVPAVAGIANFDWVLAYDQVCHSHVSFASGTMTVSVSAQTSAVQFTDLACSYFDGTWTYAQSASGLTLCKTAPNVEPCFTMN
jgi:hypothetical protein